ncbi:succinate-semialdehyde dehydrogenase (NADP(+)) [Nocardia puris]|uniref:succinic semialdehyde dehydrogenase n=1 Tax=Nocardia puris TaxID=208602 RepID=UPI001895EFAA|nr:succinic semialdehyde dehydrogenase [Nocardia puris]MBF6209826.1 succinate-semialdehyde dehydrogenase (NADP(+)) [Nocardia puris]MBF6366398.1 succinate-semialdehyde dehydrogenase (NADP(+)) [Nocardia puris]MBF6458263.1 succinate-semialdehyde dehydrogenase (NADP(+)) [Nocardia puris]
MTTAPTLSADAALPAGLVRSLLEHAVAGGAPAVEVSAPATGQRIAELPQSSVDDIDRAFATARAAQREWAATPVRERVAVLRRFHDLVLAEQDAILDIVQTETGKSRAHAFDEVGDVAVNARYYASVAEKLLATRKPRGVLPVLTQVDVRHRPKGVVAVISPWNYPLALAASDALPALVAGNAVIARPDNQTALTALWAIDAAVRAGLPRGLWQAVLGRGREIGGEVIGRADYVDYTGSSATGRTIARQAGERLIGYSLELGGKNPLLVLADADVSRAAKVAVRACFSSAGQLCESMERIYVHDGVYDKFVGEFVANVRALKLGAALNYDSDMGSLTFQRQLDTVSSHVDDAVAKGATVLAGGRARPDLGPYFYEPTVLADVRPGMTVYREETFGPVVSVYRVASDDEAVAAANDTAYGLNASVWTKDAGRGREIAARINAGSVNVNEGFIAAWGSADAPSGGLGISGTGRRHGPEGLLKYIDTQTIAVQRVLPIAPLPGMSEQLWAKTMTLYFGVMKTLRQK